MSDVIKLSYIVDGSDFTSCGQASEQIKRTLKQLAIAPEQIRRVAIAIYEGEVNMVIHANGGMADVEIYPDKIIIILTDTGNGIPDIEQAMKSGFSTAGERIRELGFGAGMGLPNMKKYSDMLHIDSTVGKGTTVTLQFNI